MLEITLEIAEEKNVTEKTPETLLVPGVRSEIVAAHERDTRRECQRMVDVGAHITVEDSVRNLAPYVVPFRNAAIVDDFGLSPNAQEVRQQT